MRIATLYKITNKINGMCYYGIVYAKNKTYQDRFEEHMNGEGGVILYEEGVKIYGRNNFIIQPLIIGELTYIKELEGNINKTNLWPIGYNGNSSHAIILNQTQIDKANKKKKERWTANPASKPIPPTWKGKKRTQTMIEKLRASKIGHEVTIETRKKLSLANIGKKQTDETKQKRKKSLDQNPNSYNKQHWLAISPNGVIYYSFGARNKFFKKIGVAAGRAFYSSLNTGSPAICKAANSKSNGWTFYSDFEKINSILNSTKDIIIKYE